MIQFDEHIFQMAWFNHQLEECELFLVRLDKCWDAFQSKKSVALSQIKQLELPPEN